jgi:hypothetical protein
MFFIQGQLSENTCGHWTEVSAYFYLNDLPAKQAIIRSLLLNLTRLNY